MDNHEDQESISLQDRISGAALFSSRLKELLPLFTGILEKLESGVFISSSANVKEYKELSRFHDAYTTLVGMVGHELMFHASGFYYLRPQEMVTLSKREKQAAAAIFCLIESLCDRGLPIDTMITSEEAITTEDLELMIDQHKERLSSLELNTLESFISNGLKKLVETGVIYELSPKNGRVDYVLGVPTYFYLSICKKISKEHELIAESTRNSLEQVEDRRGMDELADAFLSTADTSQ